MEMERRGFFSAILGASAAAKLAAANVPEPKTVKRVPPREDDTYVLSFAQPLSSRNMDFLRIHWKEAFPPGSAPRLIVLCGATIQGLQKANNE